MNADEEAKLKEALSGCFDHIDKDKSTYLDSKEVLAVLMEFNKSDECKKKKSPKEMESDVQAFIKECDKNNDQKISKKEFLDFFMDLFTKHGCC